MQAQIRRTPLGHYILQCSLAEAETGALPDHWTHIELNLGHLRILCALPEHPRQQECTLADPRLSCWLQTRVHAGKLMANQTVTLHAIYEGVFCLQACTESAQNPVVASPPVVTPAQESVLEIRPRPSVAPRLAPRPVRLTARQTARALAAQASA